MRHDPTVLEQIVQHVPWGVFDRLVAEHGADAGVRGFDSRDHFLTLLAAALGGHHGLRPTVAALAPHRGALRLLGGKPPARSTLSEAGARRPATLFTALFHAMLPRLAGRARRQQMQEAIRLIDATQLNVGARMQNWLGLHRGQTAAKLHVVYDPRAARPVYFDVTPSRINDITWAQRELGIEPGATYVFDLGYYDFAWFAKLTAAGCRFVTRLKVNTPLREIEEYPLAPAVTRKGDAVILADRTGLLPARLAASRRNPFCQRAREVLVRIDTGKTLRLFTNDLTSPAETIAALYKERWQIELFFKWIKQNLRISRFIGTSENAVRAQIAVAMIAYLLLRFMHEQQKNTQPVSIFLLVIRCHLFTRRPCNELLNPPPKIKPPPNPQLSLFQCINRAGQ